MEQAISKSQQALVFLITCLEIVSHHSLIDINLKVSKGDIHVDLASHSRGYVGYALSQSILRKLLDKKEELKDMVFFMFQWMNVYHAVF